MAKEFLSIKGVPFKSYDISKDKDVLDRMLQLTGGKRATPVITVDENVIIGFDRGKLQRLLGI